MSKQDRQGARTVSDLERKYGFGKTFAEILGIAEDAQQAAEKASEAVADLDKELTQDEIFNRLTNYGQNKGIYRDANGEIYINASYIASGILGSTDGKIQINLVAGDMPVFNTGISTNGLVVRADEADVQELVKIYAAEGTYSGGHFANVELNSANGTRLVTVTETFSDDYTEPIGVGLFLYNQAHDRVALIDTGGSSGFYVMNGSVRVGGFHVRSDGGGELELYNADRSRSVRIVDNGDIMGLWLSNAGTAYGSLLIDSEGVASLTVGKINGKTVSWKDNGDGTFTLIGQ